MRLHSLAEFAPAVPWLLPVCALFFGAGVGRFLNAVISRVPGDVSLATSGVPGGRGPRITWRENIPLLSWLLWRDRARASGHSSLRQPLVELLTGLLFLVCFAKFPPAVAACGAIFLSALVAAAFVDFDHFIIPDVFTIGLAIAGVILSLAVPALNTTPGLCLWTPCAPGSRRSWECWSAPLSCCGSA
jgi:leader peptidase (prepilin peptidase)/N-methyltransferase